MIDNSLGPPERERPGANHNAGPIQKSGITKPTNYGKPNAPTRNCITWRAASLKRRRAAAQRMPRLDCGCGPDPWLCRCSWPPLSEKMIDGGRDAARFILDAGYVPLLEPEVLRALYRRGGADRVLAERLHELTGGMAA